MAIAGLPKLARGAGFEDAVLYTKGMDDMRDDAFGGVFPILPTPFTEAGAVDVDSLGSLVRFMLERDVNGLTVLGMMGEAPKLTESEQDLVVETTVAAACGTPVVVGTGAPGTHLAVDRSRRAADLGAAGLMVAPPRTGDELAIFDYYGTIASSVGLPVVLLDYPEVTGVRMSVPLISRMHREIGGIGYIKLEDAPTGRKITQLLDDEASDIKVFGALGGVYCLEELRRGAVGIMSGFAYPEILREIYVRHVAGDADGAEAVFFRSVALMRFEFQPVLGLPLRKEVYKRRGAIRSAYIRPPGPKLDRLHLEELDTLLRYLQLDGQSQCVSGTHAAGPASSQTPERLRS